MRFGSAPFACEVLARRAMFAGASFLLTLAAGSPAAAQTESDTFAVTATVVAACVISANDHDFGDYSSVFPSATDGSSTIEVTCTAGTNFDVALDAGTTPGGSFSARLMTDGSNTLAYNLYTDSSRTTIWGDGAGSTATVSGAGTGSLQTLNVYGRIPAGQSVPVGSYSDTVTATITF